jgi:hypothetical protein
MQTCPEDDVIILSERKSIAMRLQLEIQKLKQTCKNDDRLISRGEATRKTFAVQKAQDSSFTNSNYMSRSIWLNSSVKGFSSK